MTNASPILRRFRAFCIAEGISWVLLIAGMVVKYSMGRPEAVRWPGMIHGVLFMVLVWLLARARFERGWPRRRVLRIFVASLVPIWPFLLDRQVQAWIAATPARR